MPSPRSHRRKINKKNNKKNARSKVIKRKQQVIQENTDAYKDQAKELSEIRSVSMSSRDASSIKRILADMQPTSHRQLEVDRRLDFN